MPGRKAWLASPSARSSPATPWLAQVLFEWDYADRITAQSPLLKWLLAYPRSSEEEPWKSLRAEVTPKFQGN